jgi:hypothetical protein
VVAIALLFVVRFGVLWIAPDRIAFGVFGGLILGLVVLIWWAFFSRARPIERILAVAMIAIGLAATPLILHESIAKGMMGLMFIIYGTPFLCLALVVWAVASRRLPQARRLVELAVEQDLRRATSDQSGGPSGRPAPHPGYRNNQRAVQRFRNEA